MFALTQASKNVARRVVASSTRLASSAVVSGPKNPLVPNKYLPNFTKSYLSDPSIYPLIVIMTFAMTACVGMSVHALSSYKGVRIRSEHRQSEIVTPDEAGKPYSSITEYMTRRPIGFYDFKSLRHEGLGIDHEEWKKQRGASKSG